MKELRDGGYANWLAIPGEGITADEANAIIKKNNFTVLPITDNYFAPTRVLDYFNRKGRFAYLSNGKYVLTLYCVLTEETKRGLNFQFKKYSVKMNEDDSSTATGREAFNYINDAFKNRYGLTIRVAFGYSPECLDCIPAPLNYGRIDPQPRTNFYKADVSSAYAYEACKDLPTMKGSKTCVGCVAPSKDYPFAFYPKEGKLAIYQGGRYLDEVPLCAEYTLLCPKCQYSLEPILDELYKAKEAAQDPEKRQYYKDILNYFVGWLHWRPKNRITGDYAKPGEEGYNPNCPRYAAQAAVIKARCNARMLILKDQIHSNATNEVLLINTDAIGWTGVDMPEIYTREKALGNLVIENKNAEVLVLGSKKYQIKDKKEITTKWAGVRKEITKTMKWKEILKTPITPKERMWSWEKQQIIYKEDF